MTIKQNVWAINQAFDHLPAAHKRYWLLGLLVVLPVLLALVLGASFEDESAQALWLGWVLWLMAPRVWYCHASGQSPWKRR